MGEPLLLKVIVLILATIGAIVVISIVVLAIFYVLLVRKVTLRIKRSLRDLEQLDSDVLESHFRRLGKDVPTENDDFDDENFDDEFDDAEATSDVPPMRIHLLSIDHFEQVFQDEVNLVTNWMRKHGFELIGDYRIPELGNTELRAFISSDQRVVAALRTLDYEPYVEFCFDLGKGLRGGVSNPPTATIPLPMDAVGSHLVVDLSDEGLTKMHQLARTLAEQHEANIVDRNRIVSFFEEAHSTEMDARIQRGGLSEAEIQQSLSNYGSYETRDVQAVQNDWQTAINHFLIRQSNKVTSRTNEESNVLVVYDASLARLLLDRIRTVYGQLQTQELTAKLDELESMLKRFSPREAIARFRPLLPENMRYDLIDQLKKPVEADLYLMPELEF